MEAKLNAIAGEMLPFVMADGLQPEEGREFPPNDVALHAALLLCDANCNEIRACMMECLGFKRPIEDNEFDFLIERLLETSPYRFCLERLQMGDLRQLLSHPSFLRAAHRRWAAATGFHAGPIVAKEPDWGKLRAAATTDLQTAAATTEEVARLVEHQTSRCFKVAMSLLGKHHDAEDTSQEASMRALKHAESLNMDGNPEAWLATITHNLSLNLLKKSAGKVKPMSLFGDLDALTVGASGPQSHVHDMEIKDFFATVIQPKIDQLKPEQVEVLQLFYFEGYSRKEIEDKLGKPYQTVNSLLKRALEKLRKDCAS